MNKTTSIDLSEDRLLAIAADYIEEHNFIAALRMLNKNAELNGNAEDSYMMYAETFDDMSLCEKSINAWFKYIDYVSIYPDAELADAYEGLAVNYLNSGDEQVAAYYYNRLLIETAGDLSAENRKEIINNFICSQKSPLKIAWPPRLADFSEEMQKGVGFMRDGDFESAIEQFSLVDEGNEKYLSARNYIAMCNIIFDKCDEAEQECLNILKNHPDDVQALTTLAAVKNQQKKSEESRAIAQKLLSVGATATDDIYKIATVCCENGMHAEAYKLFCRIEEDLQYDNSVLYFKAVSAYNSGRKQESVDAFDKLITIYSDAVTAKYYLDIVREHMDDEDYIKNPLSYFYRLPQEERESNIELLSAFVRLSDKQAAAFVKKLDLTDCIRWCFDEGAENTGAELKMLGAACAVKSNDCDDLLRDVLLDAFLPDSLKMYTVGMIAERNVRSEYGVVVCNIYRKINFVPLEVGRAKRKAFIRAYALTVSRFGLINADYVYIMHEAAAGLYSRLSKEKRLGDVRDAQSLAAAIYTVSGVQENGLDNATVCAFFGAKQKNYLRILGEEQ